jgi:CO/xanthine dehydrogenase Mo-binding subunit
MDVLAARLGMSPLELRLKNVLVDGDRFCTGEVMHDVHFADCLRAAAAAVDYESDPRGKGLSVILKGMQTPSRAAIGVERIGDGYRVLCGTTEMGQGARRTLALLAAELLGVDPSRIEVDDPDTDAVPYDTRTTSSRSTHMMGRALLEAVRELEIDGARGVGEVRDSGGLDPDTGQGIASSHWHQGAAAARVSVDEETGKLTVEHLHAAVYAGRVVNRPGAELQNEGSMIMGLGTALLEEITVADGQISNANLSDYNVPAAGDLPRRMTHDLIERNGAEVHGLGETALPPVPPAIGNAAFSLGFHVTDLPMTAERILDAAP